MFYFSNYTISTIALPFFLIFSLFMILFATIVLFSKSKLVTTKLHFKILFCIIVVLLTLSFIVLTSNELIFRFYNQNSFDWELEKEILMYFSSADLLFCYISGLIPLKVYKDLTNPENIKAELKKVG